MAEYSVSQKILLQVTTNLNDLTQVLNWFEQLDHSYVLNIDWLHCKTALAELFTNAVRHAHRDLPLETPISLEASLTEDTIEIKIFDHGLGFDISEKLAKADADTSTDIDEIDFLALGGRGLDLINQMVDDFTYEKTEDGRNCAQIKKNYSTT